MPVLPDEARDASKVRPWFADSHRNRSTCVDEGDGLFLGAEDCKSGRVIGDVMLAWRSRAYDGGVLGYVVNPDYGR